MLSVASEKIDTKEYSKFGFSRNSDNQKNSNLVHCTNDIKKECLTNTKSNDLLDYANQSQDLIADVAAIKVVHLSRKVRDLTSQLSVEEDKCISLSRQVQKLQKELSECAKNKNDNLDKQNNFNNQGGCSQVDKTVKRLECLVSELRLRLESSRKESSLARKVLEYETGEKITNLSVWLSRIISDCRLNKKCLSNKDLPVSIGWRGRQQKIIALKHRIKVLEERLNSRSTPLLNFNQLDGGDECNVNNQNFSGATSIDVNCIDQYCNTSKSLLETNISKSKQPFSFNNTKSQKEMDEVKKNLETDLNQTKNKLAAMKTRIINLSLECKSLKEKTAILVNKGLNDNKLIDSLVEHNESIQTKIVELQSENDSLKCLLDSEKQSKLSMQLQNKAEINTLMDIINEKNSKINQLEEKFSQAKTDVEVQTIYNMNWINLHQEEKKCQTNQNETFICSSRIKNNINDPNNHDDDDDDNLFDIQTKNLRNLFQTFENRINKLLNEKIQLEQECAKYKFSFEENIFSDKSIHSSHKTKPIVSNNQDNGNHKNKSQFSNQYEYLTSQEYVKDLLTKCGLSASGAKIFTRRIKELQMSLIEAQNEIRTLKTNFEWLSQMRNEDFKMLVSIVEDLRNQSKVNNLQK